MSKHSHWAKIKHGKGAADVKRGVMFTKLARTITIAAREKGPDPNFNFRLRLAIDQARAANMPKENVERAIARATGDGDGAVLEELLYEGILPQGVYIIIEATSDNKNRTTAAIKKILSDYGGSLGASGSVTWNFGKYGVIEISLGEELKKEDLELKIIDAGADDIRTDDGRLIAYTKPEQLEKVKSVLEKDNVIIDAAGIEWVAKDMIAVDPNMREKIEALCGVLDDMEEVADYYINIEM